MKEQHFDCWEFRQIFSLVETNPYEAKRQMEEYLNNYPSDHSAYTYYAYILIFLGYFEEAEGILNYVEDAYISDVNFMKDKKKVSLIRENLIFNKVKLLAYQKRYEELSAFCDENKAIIDKLRLHSVDFYCKTKLGIPCHSKLERFTYLFKQISNYSEDRFLKHIQKHMANFNQNQENPNEFIFVPDFPIDKVLAEVKRHIGSEKKLYSGFYEDLYVFKYNECGRVKNKLVNYFRIIALNGTDNFITMFPTDDCETLPHIDLNYLVQEESPKIKRLSQIDKFRQRYNKK